VRHGVTYTAKVLHSTVLSLRALRDQLPPVVLDAVVYGPLTAQHIFFLGLGLSGAVAQHAEHYFFSLCRGEALQRH